MNLEAGNKYLLIADREYHNLFYRYKNSHPEQQWKIITKEELLDMLSFRILEEAYPFLMKMNCDYAKVKKIIKLLRVADLSKSEELQKYYDLLKNQGLIERDPYLFYELKTYRKIFLLELQEDDELHQLLKRHDLAFEDMSLLDDLYPSLKDEVPNNFKEKIIQKKVEVNGETSFNDFLNYTSDLPFLLFPNKYIQYFHIFAKLKKMIEEDELNKDDQSKYQNLKNRLVILVGGSGDAYYLNLFAKVFHLPCLLNIKKPFISIPEVKARINQIYLNKSFQYDVIPTEGYEKTLYDLIKKYQLDEIDFKFAYSDLLELINDNQGIDVLSDAGIACTSKYVFNPDLIYVITNFQQGDFYKFFDDKNIYSDAELVRIGANPSYVQTALDRRKKFNFLRFNVVLEASRVKQHLSDAIYDSQFIEEYGLKMQNGDFATGDEGSYTNEAKALYESYLKDINHVRPVAGEPYRSYDHQFTGIESDCVRLSRKRKGIEEDIYDVTEIESYAKCPYNYYLENILGINQNDPNEDFHARWFGNLGHYIFQFIFDADFNFEKVFSEAVLRYKADVERDGQEFTPYEEMILHVSRHWFEQSVKYLREQCNPTNMTLIDNPQAKHSYENTVNYLISDGTSSYPFTGRIDKLVWTSSRDENGNEKRYYTIIDYKTGAETFEYRKVFLGLSIQLPFYYIALNQRRNYFLKNYGEFGGFGIQHIFSKNPKGFFTDKGSKSIENFYHSHALSGISNTEIPYLASFDHTAIGSKGSGKDKTVAAVRGNYLDVSSPFNGEDHPFKDKSSYTFKEMLEDAKKVTCDFIHEIQLKQFDIAPKNMEKTDRGIPCKFCSNKDICYHNMKDVVSKYADIRKKFHEVTYDIQGEEEDDDTEEDND